MAATLGAKGESWTRPGGKESAEANARRQSRAEVAGGRGFMAAKVAMKRVIAGNRDQGASIALDRQKAPGMEEASRVDARRVEAVLGSGSVERRGSSDEGVSGHYPESFGASRRSSQAGVERRRAETKVARESSPNRPMTGRVRRKAARSPIHSIPDLPKRQGDRQG